MLLYEVIAVGSHPALCPGSQNVDDQETAPALCTSRTRPATIRLLVYPHLIFA